MAQLRAISGPLAGQTIEVNDQLVIGRQGTDVVLDDTEVSRRHVLIRLRGSELEVEDLGSSNGTFVDGKRIEAPFTVHNGTQIRIGSSVLLTEGLPSPAPPEKPVADPDATRIRRAPNIEPTRLRPLGPPATEQPTRVGQPAAVAPEPRHGTASPAAREPTHAAAPPAAPQPGRAAAVVTAPIPSEAAGEFRPPERRRRRGLASRSWLPVALSYGTAGATAAALIVYFATR